MLTFLRIWAMYAHSVHQKVSKNRVYTDKSDFKKKQEKKTFDFIEKKHTLTITDNRQGSTIYQRQKISTSKYTTFLPISKSLRLTHKGFTKESLREKKQINFEHQEVFASNIPNPVQRQKIDTIDAKGTNLRIYDDTFWLAPYTEVKIISNDLKPSIYVGVEVLNGMYKGKAGWVESKSLGVLETKVPAKQLDSLMDGLKKVTFKDAEIQEGTTIIPYYYPIEGCEARAYAYLKYINDS